MKEIEIYYWLTTLLSTQLLKLQFGDARERANVQAIQANTSVFKMALYTLQRV